MTQDSSSAHDPGCQCEQCTEAQVTDASVPVSSQPAAVSSRQNPSKTAPPSDRTLLAEQEVFRHLNDHVTSEAEFISAYKELAAASSTPEAVRYLISLVLEDEERHHRKSRRRFHRTFFSVVGAPAAEGFDKELTAGLTEGLAVGPPVEFAPGTLALTLLPSCSLSTPVMTTTSPGSSPDVTSESSPSVVPMVTARTVTVESGFTTYT